MRELLLAHNRIDDKGALHLVEGLKARPSLRHLDLEDNRLLESGWANTLSTFPSIEFVNLRDNFIGKDNCEKVKALLPKTRLDLTRCERTPETEILPNKLCNSIF